MTVATLSDVLLPALRDGYAVAAFTCLGWEETRAYVTAAEAEGAPVILLAGPGARRHTPMPVIAKMFRHLAENSDVPVVPHLDHGQRIEDCRAAIGEGFTSVMYDGSADPLEKNIQDTATVAEMARDAGVSSEGEIGFVGHVGGRESHGTDPAEAARFAKEAGVDAMAISIGNIHLQEDAGPGLDLERLGAIEAVTDLPLVIHGGSGVPFEQRRALALGSRICKFNIGTEMRQAFGLALRNAVDKDPGRFDRIAILKETHDPVVAAARAAIRGLSQP